MGWQERQGHGARFLALTAVLLILAAPAWAASVAPARAVVAHFQNSLLTVMKAGQRLGFKGRYEHLMPAVERTHDLSFIAQLTLGPYWGKLSPSSRAAFVHAFRDLTVATYAAEFRRYSGQTFKRTAAQVVAQGDVLVETELAAHGRKEATIDYLLARAGGRWEIVNIVANGVSDLALKRAQYTAVIRKEGFPALLKLVQAKVNALSKGQVKG